MSDPQIIALASGIGVVAGWLVKHFGNGKKANGPTTAQLELVQGIKDELVASERRVHDDIAKTRHDLRDAMASTTAEILLELKARKR